MADSMRNEEAREKDAIIEVDIRLTCGVDAVIDLIVSRCVVVTRQVCKSFGRKGKVRCCCLISPPRPSSLLRSCHVSCLCVFASLLLCVSRAAAAAADSSCELSLR